MENLVLLNEAILAVFFDIKVCWLLWFFLGLRRSSLVLRAVL